MHYRGDTALDTKQNGHIPHVHAISQGRATFFTQVQLEYNSAMYSKFW